MHFIHTAASSNSTNPQSSATQTLNRFPLKMKTLPFICLLTFCSAFSGFGAVIFDNFESYAVGPANLVGQGNWAQLAGSGIAQVTPETGGNGLSVVLQGAQSAGFTSAGIHIGKSFANSNQSITVQGDTLEMTSLLRAVGTTQTYYQYLLTNNALSGLSGGIEMNAGGGAIYIYGKKDAGAVNSYNTGFTYAADTTYSTRFLMDFSTDTFKAYYTDITNSGSEVELTAGGVFAFDPSLGNLTLSGILGSGGMDYSVNTGGANRFYVDALTATTVPEPHVGALMVMAAGVLLVFRRNRR